MQIQTTEYGRYGVIQIKKKEFNSIYIDTLIVYTIWYEL